MSSSKLVVPPAGRDDGCRQFARPLAHWFISDTVFSYGTLTPLLRRMETGGLLNRRRGTADERVVTLELTEEGRKLAVRTGDVQQKIRAAVGLGEQEASALQATLRSITRSVREHADTD